jgi:hypothetical protein
VTENELGFFLVCFPFSVFWDPGLEEKFSTSVSSSFCYFLGSSSILGTCPISRYLQRGVEAKPS